MKFGKRNSKKKNKELSDYNMYGPEPWTRWTRRHKLVVIICVLVFAAGIFYWYQQPSGQGDAATNQAQQKTLQISLSVALNKNDEQGIINDTSQLISGASDGRFVLSKSTLAQYHLDKAYALIALGKYQQSIHEFGLARDLDGSLQLISLEGEAQAKFALGEREQLIPVLQQIVQLAKQRQSQENPRSDVNHSIDQTIAEYSADIAALQNNQKVQQL